MGFGGGGGGGGGTQRVVQTTTQQLAPQQQKLLDLVIPRAEAFVNNPPELYPGSTIAPITPLEQQAQQELLSTIPTLQNVAQTVQTGTQFLTGPVLFPTTNPALQDAINAAIRPIQQTFTQQVLPNIRSSAVQAGQFGGSRQAVAEGIASQALLQQIGDTSAQMANEAYQRGLEAMERGLLLAPQITQLSFLPASVLSAVGAQQRAEQQALLNEAVRRFVAEQLIPFQAARDVAALALAGGGGSATAEAIGPSPFVGPSTMQQVLGGAALASVLLPTIFGPEATLGNLFGSLIGAIF